MRMIPGAHQHPLELRSRAEELPVFVLRAETHDALDAGPVVPAPVEQDHLAGGRQVRDVALEVPLGLLALRRRGERDHAADPRAQARGDRLDHPALAGSVATLEHDDDFQPLMANPLLEFDELDLEPAQLREVCLVLEGFSNRMIGLDGGLPTLSDGRRRPLRRGGSSTSVRESLLRHQPLQVAGGTPNPSTGLGPRHALRFDVQVGSGPASHSVLKRSAPWIAVRRSSPGPVLVNPCASPGGLTTT